jgi:putative transposase
MFDSINNQTRGVFIKTFRNKYRSQSGRLKGYNYSLSGVYFITICTQNREHFFGRIDKTECSLSLYEMYLSEIGKIVADEWKKTAEIRKNVILGEWVVMPNHFHAVVILKNDEGLVETHKKSTETHSNASLQNKKQYINKFGSQSQNLSAIIRGFKGATTKQIHLAGFSDFAWQSRYHDHIIRDEKELKRISEYIMYNPIHWDIDSNY